MSWQDITLGECLTLKHGYAFKGEFFSDSGQHIVLTPGNFYEEGGFRTRPGKDRCYTLEPPEDFVLKAGDLVVAMTEQGEGLLGSSALVPAEGSYLHNQRIGLVEDLDGKRLDRLFLYHLFNTPSVRAQIRASATGGKVRHTAPRRIYAVKVCVPSVSTQRKIAQAISAYDDLIENNRKRIALLEDGARFLYREWFVHFRFPGHEHVRMRNGLPDGWMRKRIAEMSCFLGRGISPTYADDGNSVVVNQKCVRGRMLSTEPARMQKKEFSSDKALQYRDVLINSTGTGTLGRVAQCWFHPVATTFDSHITVVRADTTVDPQWFGYALLELQQLFEGMGDGATNQKELSRGRIADTQVVLPPRALQVNFALFATDATRQIQNLADQNDKLARARDLLLPRLMNGEITV